MPSCTASGLRCALPSQRHNMCWCCQDDDWPSHAARAATSADSLSLSCSLRGAILVSRHIPATDVHICIFQWTIAADVGPHVSGLTLHQRLCAAVAKWWRP